MNTEGASWRETVTVRMFETDAHANNARIAERVAEALAGDGREIARARTRWESR
jgi:hypothetical protein